MEKERFYLYTGRFLCSEMAEEKATKRFCKEFREGFYGLGGPLASLNREEASS